jgi:hypothetical protein
MDDIDFGAAMDAPAKPEPQSRPAEATEDTFLAEITLPLGTDIRPTALSLVPYEREVKELIRLAKEIQITDEGGRKEATKIGLRAKKLRLRVEKVEDSPAIQQALNFVKDARHLIKTLALPLKTDVEQVCKSKLTAYSETLRLAQQRREAAAREEAQALQAKLNAEAKLLKEEAEAKVKAAEAELARKEAEDTGWGAANPDEKALLEQTIEEETDAAASIVAPQVVVQVDPNQNIVRTDEGASFTTSRWVARLVNIALVDRKYLMLNTKAIQQDVDGGLRHADGFVIEEKLGTSLRG